MAKTLQELSLIDDFLFCEVMRGPIAAKGLLKIILDKQIKRVQVSKTREEVKTDPIYHAIRLDICLEDERIKYPGQMVKGDEGRRFTLPPCLPFGCL